MPHYTKVNLLELEDMARKFDMPEEMESRFGRQALEMERGGLSHFRLGPDFREPFGHVHREQEEIYVVLSGSIRVAVEDEVVEVGPMDAIRVPAGVKHGIEGGPEGGEFLAYGAGPARDSEQFAGWWPDEYGAG